MSFFCFSSHALSRRALRAGAVTGAGVLLSAVVDDGTGCNTTDHTYVMHLTPDRTEPLYLHVVGGDQAPQAGSLSVTVSADGS